MSELREGPHVAVAAAHGMANQVEVAQAQGRNEAVNVALVSFDAVIAVKGPVAIAVAPLVQGDDVVVLGQGEADEVPAVGLLGTAVQHHHQRSAGLPPFQVVEIHAVDQDAAVHRLILLGKGDPLLSRGLVQGKPQGMRSHNGYLRTGRVVCPNDNRDGWRVKRGMLPV